MNCITLKPYNNEIPGWKNSNRLFKECSNYNISWGVDETGSLYNLENIKYFAKLFRNKDMDQHFTSYNQMDSISSLMLCNYVEFKSTFEVLVDKIYIGISVMKTNPSPMSA